MKIITILGARPQFIKAATVSRAIIEHNKNSSQNIITEVIVHTGQHYDKNMSDIFFKEMDIPRPQYNLSISNLNHGSMTGRMMEGIESIITTEKPDWILVYGDTNSTLAGALVCAKLLIPLAHVEAGLRSFNPKMPEELNRVLTDRVSTLLFCPTNNAVENLHREGYPYPVSSGHNQMIFNVGDVMLDAVNYYSSIARRSVKLIDLGIKRPGYVLATIHRAENTENISRLKSIFEALQIINTHAQVVLPLHPRTRNKLIDYGLAELFDGLTVLEPVSYFQMQKLEMDASIILTDSGGVQKEAFFHKKPCLTLRDDTEWIETVQSGWNVLVGSEKHRIVEAFESVQQVNNNYNPYYGTGNASNQIINHLLYFKDLN